MSTHRRRRSLAIASSSPAGWSMVVRGPATILTLAGGRLEHRARRSSRPRTPTTRWRSRGPPTAPTRSAPLKVTTQAPTRMAGQRSTTTTTRRRRTRSASSARRALFANGSWTVVISTWREPSARSAAPGRRSSSAGSCRRATSASRSRARRRNTLDAARIAELGKFVETSQKLLGVPGVVARHRPGRQGRLRRRLRRARARQAGEGRRRHASS